MIRKASQTCCNGNPWQWVHNRNACVLRVRVHACTDKKANMCILCLHSIYIHTHTHIYIYIYMYIPARIDEQTDSQCLWQLLGGQEMRGGGGCMYVVLSDRSAANQKQIEKTQKRDYRSGLPLRPLPRSFRGLGPGPVPAPGAASATRGPRWPPSRGRRPRPGRQSAVFFVGMWVMPFLHLGKLLLPCC